MTTRLYLVRHAHADWRPDEARPLSRQGRRDAARVADRLASADVAAVYSSPSRRAVETVEGLADRIGLRPVLVAGLRELEVPPQPPGRYESLVRASWLEPERSIPGGESLRAAQARGLQAIRSLLPCHPGRGIAVGTHGNLLALVVNALDPSHGHEFWRSLTFPDIYELRFRADRFEGLRRRWSEPAWGESVLAGDR